MKEIFVNGCKLKSNKFVKRSLRSMMNNYDIKLEQLTEYIDILNEKIKKEPERFKTYGDIMPFLAGICRNKSEKSKKIEWL